VGIFVVVATWIALAVAINRRAVVPAAAPARPR